MHGASPDRESPPTADRREEGASPSATDLPHQVPRGAEDRGGDNRAASREVPHGVADSNSEDEPNTPEEAPPDPPQTPGQRMAAARKEWNMSIREVAQALNLSASTITALEEDDYRDMPGITFICGYIRSYAKLLKLDHEKLIADINYVPVPREEIPALRTPLHIKAPMVRTKRGGMLRVLLVGVVLVTLAWFSFDRLPQTVLQRLSEILELPTTTGN